MLRRYGSGEKKRVVREGLCPLRTSAPAKDTRNPRRADFQMSRFPQRLEGCIRVPAFGIRNMEALLIGLFILLLDKLFDLWREWRQNRKRGSHDR